MSALRRRDPPLQAERLLSLTCQFLTPYRPYRIGGPIHGSRDKEQADGKRKKQRKPFSQRDQRQVCDGQTRTIKSAHNCEGGQRRWEHRRHLSQCNLRPVCDHKARESQPAHHDQGQLKTTFGAPLGVPLSIFAPGTMELRLLVRSWFHLLEIFGFNQRR